MSMFHLTRAKTKECVSYKQHAGAVLNKVWGGILFDALANQIPLCIISDRPH